MLPANNLSELCGKAIAVADAERGGNGDSSSFKSLLRSPAASNATGIFPAFRRLAGHIVPRGLQQSSWGQYWFPSGIGTVPPTPVTLVVVAPSAGDSNPVTGRLFGQMGLFPYPSFVAYVWVYSASYTWFGPKVASYVLPDGSFSLANWATDPADQFRAPAVAVGIFRAGTVPESSLNAASLPASVQAQAIAFAAAARGAMGSASGNMGGPSDTGAAPPAPSPAAQPPQWYPPQATPTPAGYQPGYPPSAPASGGTM